MKYIFDFDDVLFDNTAQFKEHMFRVIAQAGVPEIEARKYYGQPEVRGREFSLTNYITHLFSVYEIEAYSVESVYENIMSESRHFVNNGLIRLIEEFGLENCYIVTNGDREFNTDKLKYSGVWDLFGGENRIRIVPDSKKPAVEEICANRPNTKVVFIDDKKIFIDQVKDIPGVTAIHYVSQSPEELKGEIQRIRDQQDLPANELKRN